MQRSAKRLDRMGRCARHKYVRKSTVHSVQRGAGGKRMRREGYELALGETPNSHVNSEGNDLPSAK